MNRLEEWKRTMKKVCPKPQEGQIVALWDNLYQRHRIPEGERNAGHMRWHRLSAIEVSELYMHETDGEIKPTVWILKYLNGKEPPKPKCKDE